MLKFLYIELITSKKSGEINHFRFMLLKSIFSRSFIRESWFLCEKPRDSTSDGRIFRFGLTGFKAAFCFYLMPKVML